MRHWGQTLLSQATLGSDPFVVTQASLGAEGCFDGLWRDVGGGVLDRTGGGWGPVEVECRVDVAERGADGVAAADEHDGREEGGAADDALGRADDLDAVEVDAVGARAVLAGQLADLRVEAERAQRHHDAGGAVVEAG